MIDWVTMRQQHHAADIVGKNVCIWLDPASGDVLSEGVGYLSHEGSYSTAVQIRAHGGLVEWSGNPSRWGRPDNVWGYTRLSQCVHSVINHHLAQYGLPLFTTSPEPHFGARRRQRDGIRHASMITTGAVLTRVDLCRNLAAGDAQSAAAYIRAASSAAYRGKTPTVHPGSVSWGSHRNSRLKIYDKGREISDHTTRKSPAVNSNNALDYQRRYNEWCDYTQYRDKLAKYLIDNGVVRQELTLGRQALRVLGLRSWDEWCDQRAYAVANERFDAMRIGCSVGLDDAYAAFVDAGHSPRRAGVLSGIVSRWYMGNPVDQGVSRATFYRYKSDIIAAIGLDITSSPDVAVLNTRVRTVDLRSIQPPSWYRHAA